MTKEDYQAENDAWGIDHAYVEAAGFGAVAGASGLATVWQFLEGNYDVAEIAGAMTTTAGGISYGLKKEGDRNSEEFNTYKQKQYK